MKFIKATDKDYGLHQLDETKVNKNPVMQFAEWFETAAENGIPEYNIMTLATANAEGQPSARMVLLKSFDDKGFVFFTNYQSHKSRDLENNNKAALLFWWRELERQVRVEGSVEKTTSHESDIYFRERPRSSQLGAWASSQSDSIPDRFYLMERFERFDEQYADQEIPRPLHWGGYRLKPTLIEFWQGRESRLHDRICYRLNSEGNWIIERLAP